MIYKFFFSFAQKEKNVFYKQKMKIVISVKLHENMMLLCLQEFDT